MKKLIILLLIIVGAGSASAQKVKVWADPSVDLSKYKTYGWDTPMAMGNPLIAATAMDAVEQALAAKGLRRVETGSELTISILTTTDSDLYVSYPGPANNVGSGLPTGMAAATQRWPITKGALIVGITDALTKNSIWRATATHTLETGPSGNAVQDAKIVEKPIRKAVGKMFKQFPHAK
jgi:hypothetical protein